MKRSVLNRLLTHVLAIVLTALPCAAALAYNPYEALQEYQAVRLEAEDLLVAADLPIENLSLAAVVDGALEPIPFQIDEYNTGGGVYFDHWEVPIDGKRCV